jgi:glycosyltransferase involved in cell wall biosynthesis
VIWLRRGAIGHPAISEVLIERMNAQRKKIPRGELVRLVFVGNDWERKGGPRLLRWHQEHFADRAELHVVSARLSARVPTDLKAKNVVIHGRVEHARLLEELLPAMDVFVFPTRFDALPAAIIEAVAAGLPVIASDLAGIPEIVRQGRTGGGNGLLCKWDDDAGFVSAIEKLIETPHLRQTMSDNAIAFARRELTEDAQLAPLFDRLVGLRTSR